MGAPWNLFLLCKHLKAAQEDGVTLSEAQVIKLDIMLRPLVQSQHGAFIDVLFDNRRVLAPTYDNLLRWAEQPGNYDLQVGYGEEGGANESQSAEEGVGV